MTRPENITAAVVQLRSNEDLAGNLETIRRLSLEAAGAGAHLISLPENAIWMRTTPEGRAPMESLDGEPGESLRALSGIAKEAGAWLIVGSFPEKSPDPKKYYTTSLVISPEGALTARYRKLHLFDIDMKGGESQRESDAIVRGDDIVSTPILGVQTGLSICYDLRFPMLYQALRSQGSRMLNIPAAFTEFTGKDHWLVLLRARAIETQTFVLAPNQSGAHGGGRRTFGKSAIIDPWGIPLAIAADGPGFALARLDFEAQDRVRQSLPCYDHRHPSLQV